MPRASPPAVSSPPPVAAPAVRWPTLFLAFTQMAMSGFGGVLPFVYRMLVERRRWLTSDEFAAQLAIAQILPGPTILNLSIMVGWRFDGLRGAVAAFLGTLLGPMCLVLVIGYIYMATATLPVVRHALGGMAAVAAGLVIATAMKMAIGFVKTDRRASRLGIAACFGALAFTGVGLMRWPLLMVALSLAPFAIGIAWFNERRDAAAGSAALAARESGASDGR